MKVKFCLEKKDMLSLALEIFMVFSTKQLGKKKNSLCCNELDSFSITECIFIRVNNEGCWVDCDEELYVEGQAAFI